MSLLGVNESFVSSQREGTGNNTRFSSGRKAQLFKNDGMAHHQMAQFYIPAGLGKGVLLPESFTEA